MLTLEKPSLSSRMPRSDLKEALSHVHWLGGGSGAGKSTIAKRIAKHFDLALYDCDSVMSDHASRLCEKKAPLLAKFKSMDMDERWLQRSPREMMKTFHWFAGEGFDLIIEDLLALPRDRAVVAEGFRLLPHLVAPLMNDKAQGIWLLPTPQFRRLAFEARGDLWDIANKTSAPEVALAKRMERDALFTDILKDDIASLQLNSLCIDGSLTEQELFEACIRSFAS